jgi:uncharacterized membrane protein
VCLKIKNFLFGLLYEQNEPSLTRVIIALAFLIFVIGTIADVILALYNIRWQDYSTFATITGGGAITGKVGDKLVSMYTGQKFATSENRIGLVKKKNPKETDENQ